jgi:hypothetical protein
MSMEAARWMPGSRIRGGIAIALFEHGIDQHALAAGLDGEEAPVAARGAGATDMMTYCSTI